MPRGKNYANNDKGVAMKAHKKNDKMEQCYYGAACTRKDCIYRHDQKANPTQKKSNEPCMAFLAGTCQLSSSKCLKRHPPKEECDRLISKYQITPCRFGEECKTKGCLFLHPSDNAFPPLPSNPSAQHVPIASAWRPAPPTTRPPSHTSTGLNARAREFIPTQYV